MTAAKPARNGERIDHVMERASRLLAECRYFEAERLAAEALQEAFAAADYDRMARILLPLQECRRQKRDMAFDAAAAGAVFRVTGDLPTGRALKPGCYLLEPPRVGIDGRLLREEADRRKVPVIVVVREPPTRDGRWPIVAIGPITVRTRIAAPTPRPRPGRRPKSPPGQPPPPPLPDPQWFLDANEALGDAAIAQVSPDLSPAARVEALYDRLQAHPDHEKLHQRLEEACREAARLAAAPKPRRPRPVVAPGAEEDDEDII